MLDTGMESPMELAESIEGLTADQAVKLTRELCARLESENGDAFHGNIWPGSVSIDEDGAAVLGEGSDAPIAGRTAAQVEYVSPEFFWDSEGTPSSDVYSLGLLLYAGCNDGYLPFQPKGGALTDKDRSGALRKRMKGETIPLPSGVSEELGAVITKALAYEPEDRYESPAALLAALNATDEALPTEEAVAAAAAADEFDWNAEPAEEPAAEPVETEEPKYSVQKDFEKTRKKTAAPATRKKKKASPVIPILCVLAVGVIGGAVWYTLTHKAPAPSPEIELEETEVVVLPAESPEATEPPESIEEIHTVAMSDLEEEEDAEETDGETDGDAEPAAAGSAAVDGMDVTPASDTVYVTGSGVNLRSGPGTTYDVADTLSRGTKLERTGTVNGWSQVQYEGKEYYVSSSLVSTENPKGDDTTESVDSGAASTPAPSSSGTSTSGGNSSSSVSETLDVVTVTGAEVNLRNGPSTSSGVVTTVTSGTELKRTGTVNGWSRVEYEGQELYISDSMIQAVGASQVSAGVGTLLVTSDVNVRSGPDTDKEILGVSKAGEKLSVTGIVDGKWYRVSYNGSEGYVNRKLVSVQDFTLVESQSGTVEVISRANVRSGPTTDYSILGIAEVGDVLTKTGKTDSGWYQVTFDGKTGYVSSNLVY